LYHYGSAFGSAVFKDIFDPTARFFLRSLLCLIRLQFASISVFLLALAVASCAPRNLNWRWWSCS